MDITINDFNININDIYINKDGKTFISEDICNKILNFQMTNYQSEIDFYEERIIDNLLEINSLENLINQYNISRNGFIKKKIIY